MSWLIIVERDLSSIESCRDEVAQLTKIHGEVVLPIALCAPQHERGDYKLGLAELYNRHISIPVHNTLYHSNQLLSGVFANCITLNSSVNTYLTRSHL